MSTDSWFRKFERDEARRQDRLDQTRARTMRGQSFGAVAVVPLTPNAPALEAEMPCHGTPLAPALTKPNATADPSHQPLDDAIRYLRTARDAASSVNRIQDLARASEALELAGYPNLSALVDEAAERIGGDGMDMETLLEELMVLGRAT